VRRDVAKTIRRSIMKGRVVGYAVAIALPLVALYLIKRFLPSVGTKL
jgi:hypothetical protein